MPIGFINHSDFATYVFFVTTLAYTFCTSNEKRSRDLWLKGEEEKKSCISAVECSYEEQIDNLSR